ncbi:sensor histidine kinase [Streptomyces sp. NPDC046215]|uniref:Anti-sigma factor RsbA family regulatory protein n=1 Tax=Streptomyces stramineus TaxID=173861 RepID=A0ABN0ZNB2_9ACTN
MTGKTAAAEVFVHPALFYRDEAEYLAGTVPFVLDGLAAGEPVAVAVPGRQLALLRDALGAEAAGAVRLIDMEQAGRNPGRIIPRVLRAFADAHQGGHVRIIGEPVWAGRSPAEYPACVQHEALINHAFTGRDVTIVCPYDTSRLSAAALDDAHATHPVIIDAGKERPSASYAPDQIIAACNRPLPLAPGAAAFAFDAETLPDARHFATRLATGLGLPPDRQDDLALSVAELTTNSVVHGGGTGTLRIWGEDGHVVYEVEDRGHLGDPLAGRHPVPPGRPGGRGLLLVHCLTDLVRTHTRAQGTTIRCYLRR